MGNTEDREFDEWLRTADHTFAESVAADLDIPDFLDQVKRHTDGALLVKTDSVDLRLGSGAQPGGDAPRATGSLRI